MAGSGVTLPPGYCEDIKYPAYQDRLLMKSMGVQAGVVEAEDFKVSAGTGLQVNIKKGKAFVEQTKAIEESSNTFYNGLYNILNPIEQNPYNNVEVPSTNSQIAQIILRVYDVGELKIGGESFSRIEWLNGTPTSGAKEVNMKEGKYEGAATLPQSSYRLAYVLVAKNAVNSSEFYIEDARKMAIRNEGAWSTRETRSKNTPYIVSTLQPSYVALTFVAPGTEVFTIVVGGKSIGSIGGSTARAFATFPVDANQTWECNGSGTPSIESSYKIY